MVIFYMKLKKYYKTQLIKNKMDLNNRKMTNHPASQERLMLKSCMVQQRRVIMNTCKFN